MSRRLDLLDALVYADAFDCALTLDEVWRYSRVRIGRDELRRELAEDPVLSSAIVARDGLYSLADRPELIGERPRRMARARALQRRGRRVAWVLRHFPFVRALALTGSLAADDARDSADVDLLVILAPGRLATAFLLMGPPASVLRQRLFCPNYYVTEGRLEMAPGDPYVARELVQARCLAGSTAGLHDSNPWLATVFPNAGQGDRGLAPGGVLQRALELPLHGRLGDALEGIAARVARARLQAHYAACGATVPEDVANALDAGISLRFHGRHAANSMVARYAARRAEVAARLEGSAARAKEKPSATTS